MSAKPILTLQMQRLGDLILSFPLLLDLKARHPQSELWVVAEPVFFQPLAPLSPSVVFFPPSHLPQLARQPYEIAINLSHRPEAALAMASLSADLLLGPVAHASGARMEGYWQLYRAALTRNNRHNAFHWADLNRLDLAWPLSSQLPAPRRRNGRKVGLFIGASESSKKPDATFWSGLARRLIKAGFAPILLGGPEDAETGAEIARRSRLHGGNFCGKTAISQLASICGGLDLLISPDTGPMHLADWLETPVLNLSMGNVHAAETGPGRPDQWILRSSISCSGCWECSDASLRCKNAFTPVAVASIAEAILRGHTPETPPGLQLFRSTRQTGALYRLVPANNSPADLRFLLENFWREIFLGFGGVTSSPEAAFAALAKSFPQTAEAMKRNFGKMLATFSESLRKGQTLPEDFWRLQPWHSRLFAGHAQMSLQNDDFSSASMRAALGRMERVHAIFAAA